MCRYCFFFNDTATTEIYTLSLHDALPICVSLLLGGGLGRSHRETWTGCIVSLTTPTNSSLRAPKLVSSRSEEHTSELQSRQYLVCRLLLEKKKKHCSTLPPRPRVDVHNAH